MGSRKLSRSLISFLPNARSHKRNGSLPLLYSSNRVIYDPDFDDNASKTLSSLQLTDGKFVEVLDEDDRKIIIYLKHA